MVCFFYIFFLEFVDESGVFFLFVWCGVSIIFFFREKMWGVWVVVLVLGERFIMGYGLYWFIMSLNSIDKHRNASSDDISCGVITLSDSIDDWEDDLSGNYICDEVSRYYSLGCRSLICDDSEELVGEVERFIREGSDVIITTGGTGLSVRDITVETLESLFDKKLDGFGEVFRAESYKDIGVSAILSRATGGVYKKTLIFALPGSLNGVKVGLDLVIGELGHFVYHAQR